MVIHGGSSLIYAEIHHGVCLCYTSVKNSFYSFEGVFNVELLLLDATLLTNMESI